jgi:hypothetical protein
MIELSKSPPPLPEKGDPGSGFGIYAAWLGVMLPVAAVGLAAGFGYWLRHRGAPPQELMLTVGFLGMAGCIFVLTGLVCSVISFAGQGGNRSAGAALVGILGVILNVGLLGSGVMGGLRAVKARTTSDLRAAVAQFNEGLKNEFRTNGTVAYRPERVSNVVQSLDKVVATGSSQDARIAAALKDFLGDLNGRVSSLHEETTVVVKLKPFDPLPLKTRDDLQMRKTTIATFLKRNQELREYVENARAMLDKHLQDAGLNQSQVASVSEGFWKSFGPKQKLLLGIRDCDQKMGESIAAALELYDQHWQKWRTDEQGNFAGLDDQKATAEVFQLKGEIQKAAAEQAELQGAYFKSL